MYGLNYIGEHMPKERKDIALTVRLFSSMHEAVRIAATQINTSPSWIVRKALRDYLIQHHPDAIQQATENAKNEQAKK
jgi:hypothetical protein